jgi:hypothetical protein
MAEGAKVQTFPVRVFISYAWESVAYRRLVKSLATRLRNDGVDARLDAWHLRGALTIPEFMSREVRHANKVLIVCSPQYRSKVHAMEDGHINGAGWEAMLVNAGIYARSGTRDQVVPVLLRGTWRESAPLFLAAVPFIDLSNPSDFEANYLDLLRRLTGHEERAPRPGPLSVGIETELVKPIQGIPGCGSWARTSTDDEDVDRRFSFQALRGDIKKATEEQYIVLDYLRGAKRALISGSAGSGKTYVAAEKAIRLSKNYPNVLFLCHNPQLASYVKTKLTKDAPVQVADFVSWVRGFAVAGESLHVPDWTHFDEPDDATLASACKSLSAGHHKYDAIIVDEAQDFRDEWWAVVKARLRPNGFFYIFHDDNQSLLPHRGSYPKNGTHLDLSKNCRNAERVFELMRCFARTLPEAKLDGGSVLLLRYQTGKERQEISKIVTEVFRLFRHDGIGRTVVLWAGPEPVDQTPIANCEISVSEPQAWKEQVTRQFERVLRRRDPPGLTFPPGGATWVKEQLAKLSDAPYPTNADIQRVRRLANSFTVSHTVRAKIERSRARMRRPLHWVGSGSMLAFGRGEQGLTWGSELVLFFGRDNWHKGIPEPTIVRITPHKLAKDRGSIPLYSVPEFKGREADIVILCLRGRTLAQNALIYVGVSRARAKLIILADEFAVRDLPPAFHWDHTLTHH